MTFSSYWQLLNVELHSSLTNDSFTLLYALLLDSGGSNWSRKCGGWGSYTDPGAAVDHHPQVSDWTY